MKANNLTRNDVSNLKNIASRVRYIDVVEDGQNGTLWLTVELGTWWVSKRRYLVQVHDSERV
jgi:hypothetical protein